MKTLIFGAGSIGNHLAYACRNFDFEVTVFDIDCDAIDRMKNDIYPQRYQNWDDKIKLCFSENELDSKYEFIIIGTPPDSHTNIALKSTKFQPKAILIEKPMTFPFDINLEKIIKLKNENKVKVFIGYNHNVAKSVIKLESLLRKKILGEILSIDVEFREKWDGIFKAHPWLSGPKDSYLGYWNKGGGSTCEHSHAISMWQHLSRVCEKGEIKNVNSSLVFVEDNEVSYDSISFSNLCTFSGLKGRVVQDVITKPHSKKADIVCENGLITWICNFSKDSDRIEIKGNNGNEILNFTKSRKDDFIDEIGFIRNILNNESRLNSLDVENGYKTMRVIEAIFHSSNLNRRINVVY